MLLLFIADRNGSFFAWIVFFPVQWSEKCGSLEHIIENISIMKRTLFLTMALAACFHTVQAATYTNLQESWCDEVNNVIYNGQGYFAVQSAANTSLELTLNLNSLYSYVNSNDYSGSSYMLLWENSIQNYGLGDNANTEDATGSRTPYLSGWTSAAWNASSNNVTYSTLQSYADTTGNVVLSITNHKDNGVIVTAKDAQGTAQTLYSADSLRYSSMTGVSGYYVNLNYVTAVTLHTASSLDTDSYVPPKDYSVPFESQRTDGTSIGRVTFLGDSITHGVDDQSYRWQLFKTLTDNGIENEIVGPREGYFSMNEDGIGETRDAGTSYGGTVFANVHLAQASGRTRNIISGKTVTTDYAPSQGGVNYGGHSTATTADAYDSNTWFCMMGTNDLLSDNGTSTDIYCQKMEEMLGGEVSYIEGSYNWRAGDNWGNMATIVNDVHGGGDTFYMLSILPWGAHNNNQGAENRLAAQEFNRNLKLWTETYSAKTGKKLVYVDVTRGMVDVTSSQAFRGHDSFFNRPGVAGTTTVQGLSNDGLHPGEQGSLIMAGNLAQAMGIGGRTAGLERQGTSGWESATVGTVSAGANAILVGGNAFTMDNGYTVDFSAVFGNGETGGWLSADNALSISLGDGTNSGTLNLSEGYIMWGDDVLFCQDNSASGLDSLRVVWHNGNAADNVLKGYYVWLGDMLIGQGLSATEGQGLNGILFSASGADGSITNLTWTNGAYAPTTLGKYSAEHAYITTQDAAAVSGLVANTVLANMPAGGHDNAAAAVGSNVDYTGVTGQAVAAGNHLVTTSLSSDSSFVITSTAGWIGLTNSTPTGAVNAQLTGTAVNAIFGVMNDGNAGDLTLEIAEGAVIEGTGKKYTPSTDVAIAGSYAAAGQHAKAASFNVYVNGGTVNGNIIGGAASGNGTINQVNLNINSGTVNGTVYGGSMGAPSTVESANIRVSGGTITDGIVAGGLTGGTVGSAEVTISGGVIKGGITKGAAASSVVTIDGNKASIGGNIEADKVTLKNVSSSGYADGFDRYAGSISAPVVVLDNVKNNILATLEGLESLSAVNASMAEITAGDEMELQSLELGGGSSLGLFRSADHTVSTETETTLTVIDSLQVSGSGSVLNANLVMAEGSMLNLAGNSLQLGSSLTLGGVALDDTTVNLVKSLTVGSSLTLFTGVDELIIGSDSWTGAMTTEASAAFSNAALNGYQLVYDGATSGKVSITTAAVPEPTTATLSLLALAALAARRRRSVR